MDGLEATGAALQAIYPASDGSSIQLFGRESMLNEYFSLRGEAQLLEERMEQIVNTIKEDMQDSERGSCGGFSVLWKTQTRQQFQPKEFEKAHPEIDLRPYYKHTTSRPFKITQALKNVV